jgi:drug/metabolite transporter (DMT)-like permease
VGTASIIGAIALIVSQSLSDAGARADGRKTMLIGCLAGLGAAVGYGASNVVTKEVVTNYTTPLVASTLALMFGTLYLFPIAFRNLPELRHSSRHGIGYIALGGVLQGTGVTLMMTALSKAPVVVATPIGSLNPLVALILAQIFLKQMERITPRIVIGTALVVAGVVLVIVGRNQ